MPTAKEPNPTLHKMEVFASNHVVAKSRFWYTLDKVKKTKGEIVSCEQVGALLSRDSSSAVW